MSRDFVDPDLARIACAIWRAYEVAIVGHPPTPGEWEIRLFQWSQAREPHERNLWVETALTAALAVQAIQASNRLKE